MLATSFACHYEPGREDPDTTIYSYETKPKSGVTEYVPSKVRQYVEKNKVDLKLFFKKDHVAKKFLSNKYSKFHVMQISRKFREMPVVIAKYCPFDFFNF